jgi:DNA-binding transcriptional MerR regulator/quercetin dioxygenase-like cupin family protein
VAVDDSTRGDGAGVGTVGIQEASRLVGVSPSAIRSWERQGLVAPLRTRAGTRRYREADVARLRAIRAWRTVDGLNAPAIRRLVDDGDDPDRERGRVTPSAKDGRTGTAPIGSRLRDIRRARGMTLRDAAAASELSTSFVSALEHGQSGASLSALHRLLAGYGTTLAALTDDDPPSRLVASFARHAVEPGGGVRIEQLARGSRFLEPQLFVLAPGATSNGAYSHAGEEFMYVLDGELGVWLDTAEEVYRLRAGDSLTFPSSIPHRFEALGESETHVIWVNTPPTF